MQRVKMEKQPIIKSEENKNLMKMKEDEGADSFNFIDNLVVKTIGGGTIIQQPPLFSKEGHFLYIVWKNTIKMYDVQTADLVRNFEDSNYKIAGMVMHSDHSNIIGYTENGRLIIWNSQAGLIIKRLKLKLISKKVKIKTFHIVKYKIFDANKICQILITHLSKSENQIHVALFDLEKGTQIRSTNITTKSREYYVDVIGNHEDNLIALLHDENLHILSPTNLMGKLHKIGEINGDLSHENWTDRSPTCVAGHPKDECVATGDHSGRVVIWTNLFQSKPYKMVCHWHTLPVRTIAFTETGGHMYTGGDERTLVKWSVANPKQRSYVPRLSASIKHIAIAHENLYVAISTLDNGITILNPQRNVMSVIQNFAWGTSLSSQDMFPAGLIVDPRTDALVLNSRTGYVQFYNTHIRKLLYNMDVTMENFFTQERDVTIVNAEITNIALNHDGTWLATFDERNASFKEAQLKFWMYDLEQQRFILNTYFEIAHHDVYGTPCGINALQFQNSTFDDGELELVVTTGKDNKFKLWNLIEFSDGTGKKRRHWRHYGTGEYSNEPATDAAFSMDGSLLGVGFDCYLTLWIPETFELKTTLAQRYNYSEPITQIKFGQHEACHLVVVASQKYILVWNLLSYNIMWSVSLNVAVIASDPKSKYMAAFTTDNSLLVFTPTNSKYVYKKTYLENTSSTLAAAFVPHLKAKDDCSFGQWQQQSQLFFLNSNRELLTLEPKSETEIVLEKLLNPTAVPRTVFSNLIAAQTSSNKERTIAETHEYLGPSRKEILEYFFNTPAHTAPPLSTFFFSYLKALDKEEHDEDSEKDDDDEDIQDDILNLNDDENELRLKKSLKITPINNVDNEVDEKNMKCQFPHDLDWPILHTLFPKDQDDQNTC